ncbi:MAG: M20/M25/M40 family metallo-hydrolase, partial [Woeseiaceae bacterium]|nr:M20/M25/M40 family metallo-hydrolase [Woeseiaceae bacterium]
NTDGGFVIDDDGEARGFVVQTGEKVYVSYRLEATDPGGHSSVPRADSAISRIARTLVALQEHRFPVDLNETTRVFFERSVASLPAPQAELIDAVLAGDTGKDVSRQLDAMPYFNALLRTTCIATMIAGGHAENAIPQTATATVNCRVLPQFGEESVRGVLVSMAAPNDVTVSRIYPFRPSPPSPLTPAIIGPITDVAQEFWPGITILPEMSTGATDGLFVRNAGIPVYAVSAIQEDPDDIRAHGQDERIGIEAFERATDYWYRLVRHLSQ